MVYGGGGIYPDVYVPIDMKPESSMVNEILTSGLTNFFLFEYLDKHPQLNNKPHKSYFISEYKIPQEMLTAFGKFLKERRIHLNFKRNAYDISKHLKASLGEIWFNNNVAGLIRNQDDYYIEKCLHYQPKESPAQKNKVVKKHTSRPIKRV